MLVLIIGQRYYKSLGLNTSTRCNIDCTLIKYLVQYLCGELISLPNQAKWIRDGIGLCGVRVRNTDAIFFAQNLAKWYCEVLLHKGDKRLGASMYIRARFPDPHFVDF